MAHSVLYDMHCHVDFMADPAAFARDARRAGIGILTSTVTPEGYEGFLSRVEPAGEFKAGLGMHPWWVTGSVKCESEELDTQMLASFMEKLDSARFVGEVGLDCSKRWERTSSAQIAALRRILSKCTTQGGKVITLHSVHAADQVLDTLEDLRVMNSNQCIIHAFGGTQPQLLRAVQMGCCFTVNMRMLEGKKGRALAALIPPERLLLETDAPKVTEASDAPAVPYTVADADRALRQTLNALADVREEDPVRLMRRIGSNSRRILG